MKTADYMIKGDYPNQYIDMVYFLSFSEEEKEKLRNQNLGRIKKFWEVYKKENITYSEGDDKRIQKLDDIADKANAILDQEPVDIENLSKIIVQGQEICKGKLYADRLKEMINKILF